MAKVEVVVSFEGVSQLLKGEDMQKMLGSIAQEIQQNAGEGYGSDVYMAAGASRAIASVYTESEDAMKDNLENNTILKAVRT